MSQTASLFNLLKPASASIVASPSKTPPPGPKGGFPRPRIPRLAIAAVAAGPGRSSDLRDESRRTLGALAALTGRMPKTLSPRDLNLDAIERSLTELDARLAEREHLLADSENRLAERERELRETEALMTAREKLLIRANRSKSKPALSPAALAKFEEMRREIDRKLKQLEANKAALAEREAYLLKSEQLLLDKLQAQVERETELEHLSDNLAQRASRIEADEFHD
jgi:hypothetical protein